MRSVVSLQVEVAMFDEPEDKQPSGERAADPEQRAKEKCDELRMHAELCAVFEGVRKFDAQIYPKLDAQIARDCQRAVARLEKSRSPESPVIPPAAMPDAETLLKYAAEHELSTNDYHIHRRPGEAMILRWLTGEQVEAFYERLQAHFDAAMEQHREEERSTHGWKRDEQIDAYLSALDEARIDMPARYAREPIRKHKIFVLSTQTADEIDILHLCDFIMGVPSAEVVGKPSAPPEEPTESDRAWFFKLFSLRGIIDGQERMFFFAFLQKADEGF